LEHGLKCGTKGGTDPRAGKEREGANGTRWGKKQGEDRFLADNRHLPRVYERTKKVLIGKDAEKMIDWEG